MTNEKRIFLAVAAVFFGMGLGVIGLVWMPRSKKPVYQSPYHPGATPPSVPEPNTKPLVELPPSPAPGEKVEPHFTFYTVAEGSDGPVLRPTSRPLPTDAKTDEAKLRLAIDAMAVGETSLLPKGTHLLRLQREGDTVLLDLSKELKENFAGNERLVINGLIATAAQLEGAAHLKIFINGEVVESLGGDQSLLEPLTIPRR